MIRRLDGVVVTHLHDDHYAELMELGRRVRAVGRRLRVFGPAGLREELARRLTNESAPGFYVTVNGAAKISRRERAGDLYSAGDTHVVVGAGVELDAWLGGLGLRDRLAAIVVPSLDEADIAGLMFVSQNRLYPKDHTGAAVPGAMDKAVRDPTHLWGPAGLAEEIRARSHDRGYPDGIDRAFGFHSLGKDQPIGGMTLTVSARSARSGLVSEVDELFDFTELNTGRETTVGDLGVTPFAVDHLGMDAYAVRIRGPPGTGTVVYSGDTGSTPMLVEAAQGADLALFEAFSLAAAELPGLHMSGRSAAEMAEEAGVQRLALVHHHWNADTDAIRAEAETVFRGPLWSARAGDRYRVGPGQTP